MDPSPIRRLLKMQAESLMLSFLYVRELSHVHVTTRARAISHVLWYIRTWCQESFWGDAGELPCMGARDWGSPGGLNFWLAIAPGGESIQAMAWHWSWMYIITANIVKCSRQVEWWLVNLMVMYCMYWVWPDQSILCLEWYDFVYTMNNCCLIIIMSHAWSDKQ